MKKFWINTTFLGLTLLGSCNEDSLEGNDFEMEETADEDTYFLIADQQNNEAHLINYAGDELFNWDFNSNLGNDFNLLSDGSMLVCLMDNNASFPMEVMVVFFGKSMLNSLSNGKSPTLLQTTQLITMLNIYPMGI